MNLEIKIYQKCHAPHLLAIKEFYEKLDLKTAIKYAAIGKDPNERMNGHYRRIGYATGNNGGDELLKHIDKISLCESFKCIFSITEDVKNAIYRLGDLWSYDTALRIGYNLGKLPEEVYIQAGVRNGRKKFFNSEKILGRTAPISKFKPTLSKLEPYMIENFLCIWGNNHLTDCDSVVQKKKGC